MVHDDYREMILARALSALDVEDDHTLNEHLSSCRECQQELEAWRSTAASLALTVTPQEPSSKVRDRILLEIRTEVSSGKKSETTAKVLPFTPTQKTRSGLVGPLAAIAAAVLLVALLGSVVVLWKQNQSQRSQVSELAQQVHAAEIELESNAKALSFFTEPGKTFAQLEGTKSAPNAHAVLAYDNSGRAVLLADGLAEPPVGKAYQLWYIVGSKPLPGKVFTADRSGKGLLEDQLPAAVQSNTIFAVTLEPEQGAQAPTGAILMHSGS
jgi:anti-sigma-K factor RskA